MKMILVISIVLRNLQTSRFENYQLDKYQRRYIGILNRKGRQYE